MYVMFLCKGEGPKGFSNARAWSTVPEPIFALVLHIMMNDSSTMYESVLQGKHPLTKVGGSRQIDACCDAAEQWLAVLLCKA